MSEQNQFGYGMSISYDDGGGMTEFAQVVNIPFPEVNTDEVERTHLQSPDRYREFVKGWRDAGEIQLDLRFTEASYAEALALAEDDDNMDFQIDFPSGASIAFEGFVKTVGGQKQLEDVIAFQITIRCSGKPTFTPGSS
jgi:hypothetical protein